MRHPGSSLPSCGICIASFTARVVQFSIWSGVHNASEKTGKGSQRVGQDYFGSAGTYWHMVDHLSVQLLRLWKREGEHPVPRGCPCSESIW